MEKICNVTDLDAAILNLENVQKNDKAKLKEQFNYTYESLKPLNFIKDILKNASESDDLKESILNNSIGLTAGYFSKLMFESSSKSPIKKIVGNAVLFGFKKIIENNSDVILLFLDKILVKITRKKQ